MIFLAKHSAAGLLPSFQRPVELAALEAFPSRQVSVSRNDLDEQGKWLSQNPHRVGGWDFGDRDLLKLIFGLISGILDIKMPCIRRNLFRPSARVHPLHWQDWIPADDQYRPAP